MDRWIARMIAVWIFAWLASGVPAGAGDVEPMTPERAVGIAMGRHPVVRAAEGDVASAEAERKIARSGWLPRVDVTADWVRSTNPVFVFGSKLGRETFGQSDFALDALNRPDSYTNAATRLSVRQNVWDAGRTFLYGRASKLGVDAAERSRSRTRDEIAFGARKAFWDAVLAQRMLEVTRAAEAAARANADLVRRHVEEGLAVVSDRMAAEVRLAEVEAIRIRAEQGNGVARAALAQALGLRREAIGPLAPPPVSAETAEDDEGFLADEALRARPDLSALDARVDQAATAERIARSYWLPEIGVGGQIEWNGGRPFGRDGSNWTVGVSVRIPVFEGLESLARTARARADLEKIRAWRDAAADGVRLQVEAARADCVSAAARLRAAESSLQAADEALRIVRDRYEEGMAVIVELLGAEASRTRVQGERESAIHDLALARASLDLAVGRAVPAPPTSR